MNELIGRGMIDRGRTLNDRERGKGGENRRYINDMHLPCMI